MTDFRKLALVTEKPYWLLIAKRYIGTKEFKGKEHNPTIIKWWKAIKSTFRDDETPWCAGFVGGVLEEAGIISTRAASARSYLNWGVPLDEPAVGCIVVFNRPPIPTQGHVGFLVGTDGYGNPVVLGGNQGDAVNEKVFNKSRVIGYRWPKGEKLPVKRDLPVIASVGGFSNNEA